MLFVAVAALLATAAQRMAREMAALEPLRAYTLNIAGSLCGVLAFGAMSWLELPPVVWFTLAFAPAILLLVTPEPAKDFGVPEGIATAPPRRPAPRAAVLVDVALLAVSLVLVHVMARGALWSPYYKITVGQSGADTVVEVNNIFHQSMAPVAQKEYFYQWPYTVFGDSFKNVLILGAGSGTDVAAALMHGAEHVDAVEIDPTILRLGKQPASRSSVRRSARHGHQRRRPALPPHDEQEVRPRRVCADRFADAAVELLGRAARELHVHRGVVPRRPRPPRTATACWSSTTTSARSGWSIGWRTPRPSPSAPSRGCTCTRRAPISASCSPARGSRR